MSLTREAASPAEAEPAPGAFAPRRRGDFTVVAELVTWDVVVLRVTGGGASFVTCLAGHEVPAWLADFDAGRLDGELRRVAAAPPDRSLRRLPGRVRRAQRRAPARVGVEHEFEVRRDGHLVDFRTITGGLDLGGVRADPVDRRAVRLDWGVVTADGREAEIAIAPEPVRPGFAHAASDAARVGQGALVGALGPAYALRGVSTHVSVSWRPRRDDALARRWATVFAPALMLLLDDAGSPGLLVRPRPGRLELCGEFREGDELAATIAFATASVRAVQRWRRSAWSVHAVDVVVEPAVERYGWYVDRNAPGADLYALGRACPLRLVRGGTVAAGEHLRSLVERLAPDLAAVGAAEAGTVLWGMAAGDRPLPSERAPADGVR